MTMPEIVPIEAIPTEEALDMLRGQVSLFHGYALALARKAGLPPDEAGQMFFTLLGDPALPPRPPAGPEDVERVARAVASFSQVTFPDTQLQREGNTWTIRSVLTDAKAGLERWGTPLEDFVRWSATVQRLEGEASGGIAWDTWRDGGILYQRLNPGH